MGETVSKQPTLVGIRKLLAKHGWPRILFLSWIDYQLASDVLSRAIPYTQFSEVFHEDGDETWFDLDSCRVAPKGKRPDVVDLSATPVQWPN